MDRLDELKQAALDEVAECAKTNAIKDHEARLAAIDACRDKWAPKRRANGVAVYVVFPQNRSAYRRPHHRFQFFHGGKMITEETARQLLG